MSKPHSLLRLTQKIYGVPHLIDKRSFESITSYLDSRNSNMMLPPLVEPEQDEEPDDLEDINGVAIIEISGPLTYKSSGWESFCGGCSYESIIEQADEYIEAGASCIVMVVDSGGGEAYGMMETADTLRKMCDDAEIPLLAYVDGCSASAAYGLSCAADVVIANPYAEIGSVGVLIQLMDQSKYLEKEGIRPVFISAGDEKIPYAEDMSFRPEFIKDLQYKVDTLYQAFASHVAKYTGLSVEDVKATQAKVYLAEDAKNVGFINEIMTRADFVTYVANMLKEQ